MENIENEDCSLEDKNINTNLEKFKDKDTKYVTQGETENKREITKQVTNVDNINNDINYESCNTTVNDRLLAKDEDKLKDVEETSRVKTLTKTNEVYFSNAHKKNSTVSGLPINTEIDFKKKVKTESVASERLRNLNKFSRKDIMQLYEDRSNNSIRITDIVKNREEALNLNKNYLLDIKNRFSKQFASPSKVVQEEGFEQRYHNIYEDFNPYNLHPIFTTFTPEDEMVLGMYLIGDIEDYHVQFNFEIKNQLVPALLFLARTTYHLYLNLPEVLYFSKDSKAKDMYTDENCKIVSNIPSSTIVLESIKEFSVLDPNLGENSFYAPENNNAFVFYSTQLINEYITKAYFKYY